MTVIKGSFTAKNSTKSFPNSSINLLNELIATGVIDESGVFLKDYTFSKPSSAAMIVVRASANGWTMWKNKDGKTLDECISRK